MAEAEVEMVECPACEGHGTVECDYCGQDTDCADCDGTGEVEES